MITMTWMKQRIVYVSNSGLEFANYKKQLLEERLLKMINDSMFGLPNHR